MLKITRRTSAKILAEIQSLTREVVELKGEREATRDKKRLDTEISQLTRDLTDKQIEWDREKEKWDREKREIEHMVGLQKKRSEFENESAKREAKLTVREENLEKAQEQFEDHAKFIEKRFDQQFKAMNALMGQFLERMPTTKQLITVGEKNHTGMGDEK